MHQLLSKRAAAWAGALAAAAVVAATATGVTLASTHAAMQIVSNGGAQDWVAVDPVNGSWDASGFAQMSRHVEILNTSNTSSAVTVTYEPAHISICSQTIQPGAMQTCYVQQNSKLSGGYFQVVASQTVLMGGDSIDPTIGWTKSASGQLNPNGNGEFQDVPFDWQQGCPPRQGSGCPGSGGVARIAGG